MRFTDKVAIVTGGASGIGLATAMRLGSEGARVLVADLDAQKGEAAARRVRDAGAPDAVAVTCDVAREDQVQTAVGAAFDRFGRLDGVVNNAGLMLFKPIAEQTGDDWLRVLSVDLLGAFYFTKHAFLRIAPGGAIVNVSSIHALETSPLVACYAAAKAALLSLTRTAALGGQAERHPRQRYPPGRDRYADALEQPEREVRTGDGRSGGRREARRHRRGDRLSPLG